MSKRFNFFWLKPSNPFTFYLTFLSERFWHITCNPQIISTRCTQDANSFSHLPSIHPAYTQRTPSISHFSVVASLAFTPLNGLRNEGGHKRCRYQGGQNMPKCKQKTSLFWVKSQCQHAGVRHGQNAKIQPRFSIL